MKRITIDLDDKVVGLLDVAIAIRGLNTYPEWQAYSIFINELIYEIRNIAGCHSRPECKHLVKPDYYLV